MFNLPTLPIGNIGPFNYLDYKPATFFFILNPNENHKGEINFMRHYSAIELWKDVKQEQWDDWQWQVRNRIATLDELKQVINLTQEEEDGVKKSLEILRMGITPYYALLNG